MSGVPLDMCAVKINKSTWSYEHRVSKHFVIFHNFPCLIASLLCCLLISFYFTCFTVRDLCRSGCRQNYYLTPPLPPSFDISARLKLVSVPFNSLLLDIGHLKKSSPCWKRGLQERCLPTRREATNFQIPNTCSALDKSRFLIYAKSRHMRAHFWHAKTVSKEHTTSKNRPK